MGILITAVALILGYGTAYVASEDVRYLTRAGIEQTAILEKGRPLERLVADSSLPAETRAYLGLVLAVREHAVALGLDAGKTYTTYSDVGRDTLLLVLSASPKNCGSNLSTSRRNPPQRVLILPGVDLSSLGGLPGPVTLLALQLVHALLSVVNRFLHGMIVNPDAATALLCWGSGKGVCEEVGRRKGLRVIQPVVLWPFPEKAFGHAMEGVEQFYAVETNESGQLAGLVSRFGFRPAGKILKYDGRPFMVNELDELVDRVIP